MDYGLLILVAVAVIYVVLSIRIAGENERFAVFMVGRFAGLKGPALVLRVPGASDLVRIALGAEGEVRSNELVSIGTRSLPYVAGGSVRSGAKVRVSGFEAARVKVEPLQTFLVCEKCGHKNPL
ncbi:MAG: hypothetical protein OEW90_07525 [Betaproteobacteria bacterium]|nr:hypothetical protein [Betaproteobacteria bacterium]